MFRSPRYLVFKHAQRAARKRSLKDEPDENLAPGQERLRAFFIPGMQAGLHTIEVSQPVEGSGQQQTLETTQQFNVQAPRFVLPEAAIHTTYPPQGFSATAETLPHVIFNDPTFPWERVGSWDAEKSPPSDFDRNRTPWLALFIFTEDELRLPESSLSGDESLFKNVPSLQDGAKQDTNFALTIPINEVADILSTANPYVADVSADTTSTSMILLKRELFTGLFSKYDGAGEVVPTPTPYVYHHRFLAHKRILNTEGMAVSGAESTNDTGAFGVVVSHRSGPPDITVPTPVFAHLVSIEGVEQLKEWPLKDPTRFVALASLASWSYICLPPETPNIRDQFVHLGQTLAPLRPFITKETWHKLGYSGLLGARLGQRIEQGYAASRYRVQSGETTTCFVRGPFIPVKKESRKILPETSMLGSDLSFLDRAMGIMDISYSSAWQLGRTMAIADQAFTTSLYRVRTQILQRATDASHEQYATTYTWYKNRETLLAALKRSVETLAQLPEGRSLMQVGSIRRRWMRDPVEPFNLSYQGPIVDALIDTCLEKAAKEVASTPDPENPSEPSDKPYNEFNAPFSADWVVVLRWVLDRLFLDDVPAHYLIPDAAQLPEESLRFFAIDDQWMDCFVDGALSLGNHVDRTKDKVRDAIKSAIDWYLECPLPFSDHPPPIPKYGCYIRSGIVAKFPDLIVNVQPRPAGDGPPVLLRHEVVDKGTMICLFSQPPSPSTFTEFSFTQPPHQQTFSVGAKVEATQLTVALRRAYTVDDPQDVDYDKSLEELIWKRGETTDRPVVYLWDGKDRVGEPAVTLNILLMDNFVTYYNDRLNALMDSEYYSDTVASSALAAWQLNTPAYLLPIKAPPGFDSPVSTRPRKLPVSRRTPPQLPTPPVQYKVKTSYGGAFVEFEDRLVRQNYRPSTGYNPMGRYMRLSRTLQSSKPMASFVVPKAMPRGSGEVEDEAVGVDLFPDFRFFFWSAEQPGTPATPGTIPMYTDIHGNPMPQDLIFSINLVDNAYPEFEVTYVEIEILQGPPPTDPRPTFGPLMATYDGSGGAMLSNLRFNPSLTVSQTYSSLIIRLVPRTMADPQPGVLTGYVRADRCRELSFVLRGVKVNVSPAKVTVEPKISIHYLNRVTQAPKGEPKMTLTPVEYPPEPAYQTASQYA